MSDAQPAARKASRLALPRWLDPKLLLGVLLVIVAMLLGARVFAMADNTVEVFAVKADMHAGDTVTASSLTPVRVRFTSAESADSYIGADQEIPQNSVLLHDVRAGQFLPRAAFTQSDTKHLLDIALPVGDTPVPPLSAGDHVKVVVQPGESAGGEDVPPQLVLDDVVVVQTGGGSGGLTGSSSGQALTVRVDPTTQKGFDPAKVAGAMATGTTIVIRIG